MKKFTIVLWVVMSTSILFAQTSLPAFKEGSTRINPNAPASRQLAGTLTSVSYYATGTTMDLIFELELSNTDHEYADSLAMTFATAFTVNGSPDDPFPSQVRSGQAQEALNGVTGQTISWGDNDNGIGGIETEAIIPFRVNVTVASGVTGPQVIGYYLSGVNGSFLVGTVTVEPAPTFAVPKLFGKEFETFTSVGASTVSHLFTFYNVGLDTLSIDSFRVSGAEFTSSFGVSSLAGLGSHNFEFTYTPVNLIDDVDSFFIYSDSTVLKIALNGYPYGDGVVLQDFEEPLFPKSCNWLNIDSDGDGNPWIIYPYIAHRGSYSIASESWRSVPLFPDNYLILPKISPDSTVPGKALLRYWVAAQDPLWPAENYSVIVSTTDSSLSSFSTTVFTEVVSSADWKQIAIDLKQYHGQDIFVAFRHHNISDQYVFKIDDIRFPPLTEPNPIFPALVSNLTVTDEMCEGDMLGSAFVNPSGGSGVYEVSWSTGDLGTALDSIGSGNYSVVVIDNCATLPDTQAFTVGFDNPLDDASFAYDAQTYCNTGSNPTPVIMGLSGGNFLASSGLRINILTGEIDLARSSIGGPYDVVYMTNGPCPNTDTVSVSIDDCTGFEDLQSQGMEVYPNPNNGLFVIHNQGQACKAEIEVLDIQGRSIFAKTVQLGLGEKYQVELNDVTPGVYLLKVRSEDQVGIERVMVR